MSPEQLRAREVTSRSDVFALGLVLAYAATGHEPFEAPSILVVINHILNDPPNLDPLTGDLRDIISACLAKDPGSRPGTDELLARLGPVGAGSVTTASREEFSRSVEPSTIHVKAAPGRRGYRRLRQPAVLLATGAVAVIGLAALGFFLLGKHPAQSRPTTGQHPGTPRPATGALAGTIKDPGRRRSGSNRIQSRHADPRCRSYPVQVARRSQWRQHVPVEHGHGEDYRDPYRP